MVFSSLSFLLYFLPLVLILYYLCPKRLRSVRNLWLLAVSLCFYAAGGLGYLPLLIGMILAHYLCGLLASPARKSTPARKLGVALAALVGVGLMGYYKYAGFITGNLSDLGLNIPVLQVVLPVGISFFTFQGMSYVFDVYRGDAPAQKNPLYVALYVAFFPQLVAGPIVRYTTVAEEILHRKENLSQVSAGIVRFCFGLGKKMLLANTMGQIADAVYGFDPVSLPAGLAWVGALAYTLQIYFDFSAYSDMAIGLGKMFGFHFLENFNYPYISASVTEFWTRWHISLSSWFRDYVYIPLGGNRRGKLRQLRNLFVVWFLTGLWHGASWNFVVWGLWFFLLLIGEKYLWGGVLKKLPRCFGWLFTLLVVLISWIFFRSPDLSYACRYLLALIGGGSGIEPGAAFYYLREYWIEWIFALVVIFPVKDLLRTALEVRQGNPVCRTVLTLAPKLLALLLLAASYLKLSTGSFNPFIYFQF